MAAGFAAGICADNNDPGRLEAIAARVHPTSANIDNEADKLVSTGRLTVPLMHIWNHGDQNTCGSPPGRCPLRDGSQVTMGFTDCIHEPMRAAIAALGPASRSENLPLCVDNDATPDCSTHVVTNKVRAHEHRPVDARRLPDRRSWTWVHARLADT